MGSTQQYADAIAGLLQALDRALAGRPVEHVLEAGCGSASKIAIGQGAHLTGIDVSEKQLQRNAVLHEKIHGDIQTYPLPEKRFDVAVCWDVLEHLPQPERAIENLRRTVRDGGLILLAFPNLLSAKGLLTKFTPFRFHVWVRRAFFGERQAGMEDSGPFPTYLRPVLTPRSMTAFADAHGLIVEYLAVYESRMHRQFRERHPVTGRLWTAVAISASILSAGRVRARATDILILLRKS